MKAVRRGNRAGEESGLTLTPAEEVVHLKNLGPSTENAEVGNEETRGEPCRKDEQGQSLELIHCKELRSLKGRASCGPSHQLKSHWKT